MKREKRLALKFVLSESQENFISRSEPSFRSWELVDKKPKTSHEFAVTVVVQRMIQGNFYNWKVTEDWVFDGRSWKVRISDQTAQRKDLYRRVIPVEPKAGALEVFPTSLKIHFLSKTQRGSILIHNGLEQAIQVHRLDYDKDNFELVDEPGEIPSGAIARITILYKGLENRKNLKSQLSLVLKQSSEERLFSIPVIYNYITPGTRGLLGLTSEEAEQLKRGDRLSPKITLPSEPSYWEQQSEEGK